MRKIITCSLVALGLAAVTPAMAQGVYLGPNGVGVDSGIHHRDFYRDNDRGYGDHDGDYEGRSAYERDDHARREYRDDN